MDNLHVIIHLGNSLAGVASRIHSEKGKRFNDLVASELRKEIQQSGMAQYQVGALIETNGSQMTRYLSGDRDLELGTFYDICSAVGGSPGDIVRRAAVAVDFPGALIQQQQSDGAQQQQSYGTAAR